MTDVSLYGLIGYPLSHSFSERYFSQKWAAHSDMRQYRLFPMPDLAELPQLLRLYPQLRGLNVTIPHKQAVLPYLHELSAEAADIGAVNCITIDANTGRLRGYNTDVLGFAHTLQPLLRPPQHRHALVLGTGGAARAVAYVLRQYNIAHCFVSRSLPPDMPPASHVLRFSLDAPPCLTYAHLRADMLPPQGLILINTTPLGMYPHTHTLPPLPYEAINGNYLCYDLVYNPSPSLFLQTAALQGAVCQDGLAMLYRQADEAERIWLGK